MSVEDGQKPEGTPAQQTAGEGGQPPMSENKSACGNSEECCRQEQHVRQNAYAGIYAGGHDQNTGSGKMDGEGRAEAEAPGKGSGHGSGEQLDQRVLKADPDAAV